jgi:hypothetical protein
MEFKDLKSAWDKYSSQEVDKHHLGKESIHELLRTKTKTLVDRIDRNLRIGMAILLAFIAYIFVDDLVISKIKIIESIEYPTWLYPLDIFTNTLIVTTYLFFVIRYIKIKRSFSVDLQLKDFLTGILDTLKTYRRLFYLAVIILIINIMVSFTAGLYLGIKYNASKFPGGLENISVSKIFTIIGVGLLFLLPMIAGTFFLLRWGFNRLYGRYLIKLNETLQELNESETGE